MNQHKKDCEESLKLAENTALIRHYHSASLDKKYAFDNENVQILDDEVNKRKSEISEMLHIKKHTKM